MLIVQTGHAIDAVRRRRGDYPDWIAGGLSLARDAVDVAAVCDGGPLPDAREPAGVVLTGSSAMVSDRAPWSERAAAWLAEVVAAGTPVFGICYGHQLLAHALGGRVGPNPRGREIGTVELRPRPEADGDPMLGALEGAAPVHTTHMEAVLELPAGATLLAESDLDPRAAFRSGESAWGVQFHPEFDADVMRGYLVAQRRALSREGRDVEALSAQVRDAPLGPALLRRFAALVAAAQGRDPKAPGSGPGPAHPSG